MQDMGMRQKALEKLLDFISSLGEGEENSEGMGSNDESAEMPEGKAKIDVLSIEGKPEMMDAKDPGEMKEKMKGIC
jgi:hypothetical protein